MGIITSSCMNIMCALIFKPPPLPMGSSSFSNSPLYFRVLLFKSLHSEFERRTSNVQSLWAWFILLNMSSGSIRFSANGILFLVAEYDTIMYICHLLKPIYWWTCSAIMNSAARNTGAQVSLLHTDVNSLKCKSETGTARSPLAPFHGFQGVDTIFIQCTRMWLCLSVQKCIMCLQGSTEDLETLEL